MSTQLSELVSLISEATKVVEAEFAKSEDPQVPSLDDTTPHPLDDLSSMEMKEAVKIIEGACAQLCALVARPSHTVLNKMFSLFEPACINVVVNFKIPDLLLDKPRGVHVSELSKLSGCEEGKLARVLRLLATKHCFREVESDVFANNRLSILLLSSNGLSHLSLHITDDANKCASVLSDNLKDKDWGHSYAPNHAPFNTYSKCPVPLFAYFDTPEGSAKGQTFGLGMQGWGKGTEAGAVVRDFPWKDLPKGASICDVGGGIGHISIQLAKTYPDLRIVLQDLPQTIQQAEKDIWPKLCPEAIENQKVQFKAFDFLLEDPVPGCDVYYLKNIVHDWPDKECVKILTGVKNAMTPKSRVLVHEYILQRASRESESAIKPAPEPLLPNYGAGGIRQYNLDLDMMVLFNSQERHLEHFISLGKQAGLKFVKVWDLKETGLVEFALA
ncbi:S-adenosyl-L-methionine-dependent methyltransferase [Gymnopus androsaceus JB14]|uniref:S-adenosyl-L-methionine-dependent methyltransferase n=1 Tax=Gymnopus androsaceus JB14 TaxID=1447944 RepID=A0A6A4HGA8_9AGAR|nr:S-adenosyl-L-methionine-dependent methyltransferase [Gymnopus androsaceus JB14]